MIPTYQAQYHEGQTEGVFAIGLVARPAMEGNFVALSADEPIALTTLNEEKRILLGLILEPNKPVLRKDPSRGEYNIVFSEETIAQVAYAYLKHGYQSNASLEHRTVIDGVYLVETWLVEDPAMDKMNLHGMSYPKGAWLGALKVENDEIWDDYVKTGKIKGFSIEAQLQFTEVQLNKSYDMNIAQAITSGFEKVLAQLSAAPEEPETKLGKVQSGDTEITYDGDTLAEGSVVWIVSDDDTRIALPEGSYELEDGRTIVVEEEGIVASIEQAATEPTQEEMAKAVATELSKGLEALSQKLTATIEQRLSEIETRQKSLGEELTKLSKQPASNPIPTKPRMATPSGSLMEFINNLPKS